MAVDISNAIETIGRARFEALAAPAAEYGSSGVMDRASAIEAIGPLARELRKTDPSLRGARSSDIAAAIVAAAAGISVSGRTVERDVACASLIADALEEGWVPAAEAGELPRVAIEALASMPKPAQARLRTAITSAGIDLNGAWMLVKRASELGGLQPESLALLRAVEGIEAAAAAGIHVPPWLADRALAAVRALKANAAEEEGDRR